MQIGYNDASENNAFTQSPGTEPGWDAEPEKEAWCLFLDGPGVLWKSCSFILNLHKRLNNVSPPHFKNGCLNI